MTPFYLAGREQTCDNAGLAASGDLNDSITASRMLSAGHTLSANINTKELETEAVIRIQWMVAETLPVVSICWEADCKYSKICRREIVR